MPSITETLPIYTAKFTAETQATVMVALTKHIADLQQNAVAAKGLGLWDNEQYFSNEARVAAAAYNAILRAE